MSEWYDFGGTLGGSVLSGIFGAIGTNHQAKVNARLMREAQAFTKSEREASQSWQDAQRRMQNKYSEAMYNKYSSPQAMAQQYKAAGLNPKLAVDGSQLGTGASSGSSGGAPSGEVISSPYQTLGAGAQSFQSISQGILGIASAFKSISEAKKAGVETIRMETFLNDELREIQLSNEAKKLSNSLAKFELPAKQARNVAVLLQDITKGELSISELRKRIESLDLSNKLAQKEVDNWFEDFTNRQENIKSQTSVNNSVVSLNKVKEATERSQQALASTQMALNEVMEMVGHSNVKLNDSLSSLNDSRKNLNDLFVKIKSATKDEEIDALRQSYAATRERVQQELNILYEELQGLKKENKWKEASMISDIIMKYSISLNQISSAFGFNKTENSSSTASTAVEAGATAAQMGLFF